MAPRNAEGAAGLEQYGRRTSWASAKRKVGIASWLSLAIACAAFMSIVVTIDRVEAEPAAIALQRVRTTLDTVLLPLSIDTVSMPHDLGLQGGGGGITVVDDTVVIVDSKGSFFTVERDSISKLVLPPITNNADDYARFAPKPFPLPILSFEVNTGFRVHDVESLKEATGIRLFVAYERYLPGLKTTALTVSAIRLGKDWQPQGRWQDIYQGPPLAAEWYSGLAAGGRMLVRGDDLYLTVGDYNQDNVFMSSRLEAQQPDSDFGKILKIDLRTNAKTRMTRGHRNPQGLAVTEKGTMYSTEHGPQGGDELNLIVAGKNYGWPIETYGVHYGTYDWPHPAVEGTQPYEKPVFAWVPSIAVSNLIEISNFHPAWDRDLLVESLRAKSLFRLRRDGDGRIVYSEPINIGHRLRDIGRLPDGTLVLWTDDAQLILLSVDHVRLAANRRPAP